MSFLLASCPNCGPRDVAEYRGGEIASATATNLPGPQRERWYHPSAAGGWLLVSTDIADKSHHRLADGRLSERCHRFAHQAADQSQVGRSHSLRSREDCLEHGQSIAAALFAGGQRIFSRSFKYHRPRGLFCVAGECPNCLMDVDGRPNVRTCIEPARPGQMVRHQNAWPSLEFDALRLFDRLDRLLPVGFYYKRFHKPRWIWPIFEHVVRHLAGNGRVNVDALPERDADVEHCFRMSA